MKDSTLKNACELDNKSCPTTANDNPTSCLPCGSVAPESGTIESSKPHLVKKQSSRRTQRGSADFLLQVGDVAPNFQLQAVDGIS
mmetsp:Transcript_16785/g.22976  ORF Transcript_16785/g.22976 Transcript_16785/m.22976 type:complete len:85 (+) Transcript_16785:442-696(+)